MQCGSWKDSAFTKTDWVCHLYLTLIGSFFIITVEFCPWLPAHKSCWHFPVGAGGNKSECRIWKQTGRRSRSRVQGTPLGICPLTQAYLPAEGHQHTLFPISGVKGMWEGLLVLPHRFGFSFHYLLGFGGMGWGGIAHLILAELESTYTFA